MRKTRCDPIDYDAVLSALVEHGSAALRRLYVAYASVAARPYARSTWELMLKAEERRRKGRHIPMFECIGEEKEKPAPDEIGGETEALPSDGLWQSPYWDRHDKIKPFIVLTTVSENARLNVRASSLIVRDGERVLVYEKRSVKPQAIVMTGWGGGISIEAMRYCTDYKIAIVILDWDRDYMTAALPAPKRSGALIGTQITADELSIARAVVHAKVAEHCRVGAVDRSTFMQAQDRLLKATKIEHVLIAEAQAARVAWSNRVIALQWREAGNIPPNWKLPYTLRRRLAPTPKWQAQGANDASPMRRH